MIVEALNDNCLAVMAEACQYFYQLRKKIQTQGGIELVWSIHLQALLLESIFAGKIQLDKTILLQLTVGVPERSKVTDTADSGVGSAAYKIGQQKYGPT